MSCCSFGGVEWESMPTKLFLLFSYKILSHKHTQKTNLKQRFLKFGIRRWLAYPNNKSFVIVYDLLSLHKAYNKEHMKKKHFLLCFQYIKLVKIA